MYEQPFRSLSVWASKNFHGPRHDRFLEHRHAVEYHLHGADDADRASSTSLYQFQYVIPDDWRAVHVINTTSRESLIRNGDMAIRSASSALDTSLQVINCALDLGLEPSKLRWKGNETGRSMRPLLAKLQDGLGQGLANSIDSAYDSIGFEMLQGYRNWVTHRGAPSVLVPDSFQTGIPIPDEIRDEQDLDRRKWQAETFVLKTIWFGIRVVCWPFVPPVQDRLNLRIDKAESDIDIAGQIHIGKGSQNIVFEDVRLATGSMTESSKDFRAKNKVDLGAQQLRVAGEDLAVYSASDYSRSVDEVVRFAEQALTEWDTHLAALCAQMATHSPR